MGQSDTRRPHEAIRVLLHREELPGKYPNWPQRNAIRIPGGWPFGLNGYTEVPDGFYPVIRVDGHCFSTFTRQFEKPYDMRIINAMKDATIKLVDVFHALLGYTQSDKMTIVLPQDAELFGRKCQKIATLAASTAAVAFYDSLLKSGYSGNLPHSTHVLSASPTSTRPPTASSGASATLSRTPSATSHVSSTATRNC